MVALLGVIVVALAARQPPAPLPGTPTLTPADERLLQEATATWAAFRAEKMIRPGESQDDWRARIGPMGQCDVTRGTIQVFQNRDGAFKPVRLPPDACLDGTSIVEYGPGPRPYPGESNHITLVRRGDQRTGVTSIGRVSNPDPRFDFLREALK